MQFRRSLTANEGQASEQAQEQIGNPRTFAEPGGRSSRAAASAHQKTMPSDGEPHQGQEGNILEGRGRRPANLYSAARPIFRATSSSLSASCSYASANLPYWARVSLSSIRPALSPKLLAPGTASLSPHSPIRQPISATLLLSVVTVCLHFGAIHGAFEHRESKLVAVTGAFGLQGAASILKRPAFVDGHLGASKQGINHPGTMRHVCDGCCHPCYLIGNFSLLLGKRLVGFATLKFFQIELMFHA